MEARGGVQVLKMPVAGKPNQVASNVTLHISFPQDGKRPTPATASTPDNGKSNRLPMLRHNTKLVTLTSSSPKLQRGSGNDISPFPDLRVGLPKITDSGRLSDDGKRRRLPIRVGLSPTRAHTHTHTHTQRDCFTYKSDHKSGNNVKFAGTHQTHISHLTSSSIMAYVYSVSLDRSVIGGRSLFNFDHSMAPKR